MVDGSPKITTYGDRSKVLELDYPLEAILQGGYAEPRGRATCLLARIFFGSLSLGR